MLKCFCIAIMIFCSNFYFGQKKTELDYKKNQQLEKDLVVKNKLTSIEVVLSAKDKKSTPIGKKIYYFNSDGFLIKSSIWNMFNGTEKETWTARFTYGADGICDSVPTDKGIRKAVSFNDKYPSCYWHLGNKKLKDGFSEFANGGKLTYYFKYD
jgi:hypothetical protein